MTISKTFWLFTSGANISGTLRLECQKKNFSVRHDVFMDGWMREIWYGLRTVDWLFISAKRGLLNFWPLNLHGCERCIKSIWYFSGIPCERLYAMKSLWITDHGILDIFFQTNRPVESDSKERRSSIYLNVIRLFSNSMGFAKKSFAHHFTQLPRFGGKMLN